ncbi:DUF6588 family protein [Mucilaginibacter sp. AW1-3]
MKKVLILAAALFINIELAKAQSSYGSIFVNGPADVTKIMRAFSPPFFKMYGNDLNSGWATSAQVKRKFHFEISGNATIAFVPQSEKTYDLNDLGLSNNIKPNDPNNTISPTFGGIGIGTAAVDIYALDHVHYITHKLPSAVSQYLVTPQIQLAVGLWYNTDIIIRFVPTSSLGSEYGSATTIGFGVKHELTSDLGKGKPMPFDLAVVFGYTRSNYSYGLTVLPEAGAQPKDPSQSTDFSNQQLAAHLNNFNVGGIISKKFGMIAPFLSVSYQNTNGAIGMYGNYPFTNDYVGGKNVYTTFTDPVQFEETSLSGIRADIGLQAEYNFIKVFGSAGLSQYLSVSAGLALQF